MIFIHFFSCPLSFLPIYYLYYWILNLTQHSAHQTLFNHHHISLCSRCTRTLSPPSTSTTCTSWAPGSARHTSPGSRSSSTGRCFGWSRRCAARWTSSSGARSSSSSSRWHVSRGKKYMCVTSCWRKLKDKDWSRLRLREVGVRWLSRDNQRICSVFKVKFSCHLVSHPDLTLLWYLLLFSWCSRIHVVPDERNGFCIS